MLSGKNGPSTNVSSGRQKGRVKVGSIKSGSMEKLHSIVKGGKEARERDLELKRQQQRERELAERAERRKSLSTRKLQHVRRENSNLTESSETGKSHLSQPLSDPEVHHTECCSSPEAVDFAQALSEGESIDRSVSSFEKGDDDIGDNNDDDKSEEILRRRYHTMPNRSPWKPLTPSKGSSSDKIEADVDSPTDTLNDSPQIGRRKATLPRQRIEFLKEVKPSSRTESPPPTDSIVSKQGIRGMILLGWSIFSIYKTQEVRSDRVYICLDWRMKDEGWRGSLSLHLPLFIHWYEIPLQKNLVKDFSSAKECWRIFSGSRAMLKVNPWYIHLKLRILQDCNM